jgi:hypothetical protein
MASLDIYNIPHFVTLPVQLTNISEHHNPTALNWLALGSLGYLELLL